MPKKLPEKPPTVPIGFDFEMEKRIKQREKAERVLEDKHFNAKPCPYPILLGVVGFPPPQKNRILRILEWVVISFFNLKYEGPISPSLNKEN